jgi:ribosomal protein L7/L12
MWEYTVRALPADPASAGPVLDELGRDGWELVAVLPGSEPVAFLKRARAPDGSFETPGGEAAEPGAAAEAEDAAGEPEPPLSPPPEPAPVTPSYEVLLTGVRGEKSEFILALTQLLPGMHLKDAKRLVDALPVALAGGLEKDDAMALCQALNDAGGVAEAVSA